VAETSIDDYRGVPVLVTGGTGPLGRCLVGKLIERQAKVLLLTRDPQAAAALFPGSAGIRYLQADLSVPLPALPDPQPQVVFHLASHHPAAEVNDPEAGAGHWQVTVGGTRNLLHALEAVSPRSFVFASSDRAERLRTDYGRAKAAAEQEILAAGARHGWDSWILRFASLYGPATQGMLSMLAAAVRAGRMPAIPDLGDRKRLLHVEDAARALLHAGLIPGGGIYSLAERQPSGVAELVRILRQAAGLPTRPSPVVTGLLRTALVVARATAPLAPGAGLLRRLRRLSESDVSTDRDFSESTGFALLHEVRRDLA